MSSAWRIARMPFPVACLMVLACGQGDHGHGWDWERMRQQPRSDPYAQSSVFANGRVMQRPPVGTVPRERITGNPPLTTGQENGHFATRVPIRVTPALLATGQSRFGIFCAACHGAGGYGGSIVAMNMQPPRPPSLRSSTLRAVPPGFVFHVITNGFGRMPPFAAELSVRERWAVVAYVRQLQQTGGAGTAAARADSARAARLRTLHTDTTSRTGADSTGPRSPSTPGAPTNASIGPRPGAGAGAHTR